MNLVPDGTIFTSSLPYTTEIVIIRVIMTVTVIIVIKISGMGSWIFIKGTTFRTEASVVPKIVM